MEVYLQRIRKYAQTLPDTVIPPQNASSSTVNAPRVGTPQPDSGSWAGWAISSFTNKLAGASGEIQTGSNGMGAPSPSLSEPSSRPSSVPPRSPHAPHKPSGLSKSSAAANPFAASSKPLGSQPTPEVDTEDFNDAWGEMDDDDAAADAFHTPGAGTKSPSLADDAANAFDDPWGTPAVATGPKPITTTTYDDGGEPDFAGWLAAQSQSKKPSSKPLPKGLTKAAATRPGAGLKSNSTGNVAAAAKKSVVTGQAKKAPVKPAPRKVEVKQEDEEDEAWGDAWE